MKNNKFSEDNSRVLEFPPKSGVKSKKKKSKFITAIIFLLCITVVVCIIGKENTSNFDSTNSVNSESISLSGANNYSFSSYKEGYIFASDGKISCYNTSNTLQWQISGSKTAPKIVTNDPYVLTYYPDDTIAVVTNGSKTKTIKTQGKVIQGYVNSNGFCAFLVRETGLKNKITVYDNEGKMIYYRNNPDKLITHVSLSDDNKTLLTTELVAEKDFVSTEFVMTNVKKNIERARIKFSDDIPAGCNFVKKSEVIALFETKMVLFNLDGKIKQETEFENNRMQKFSYDNGYFAMLFNEDDSADVGSEIVFYNKNCKRVGGFSTQDKVYNVEIRDRIVLMTKASELVSSNFKGKEISKVDVTYDTQNVLFMGNKKCALVVSNAQSAKLMPLK